MGFVTERLPREPTLSGLFEVTSPDPTEARAMTDLDHFRAELASSLAGLSPSQRLKAGREMADRLGVVLAAIDRVNSVCVRAPGRGSARRRSLPTG